MTKNVGFLNFFSCAWAIVRDKESILDRFVTTVRTRSAKVLHSGLRLFRYPIEGSESQCQKDTPFED